MALSKMIPIMKRICWPPIPLEAFNAFNHAQFLVPLREQRIREFLIRAGGQRRSASDFPIGDEVQFLTRRSKNQERKNKMELRAFYFSRIRSRYRALQFCEGPNRRALVSIPVVR